MGSDRSWPASKNSRAAGCETALSGINGWRRNCKNESEFDSAIKEAGKYDRSLLVEKFVSGRELTIGVLGGQALPILEIIPNGGFYDFTNKYPFLNPQAGGGAEHVCPARIDEKKTAEIQEL